MGVQALIGCIGASGSDFTLLAFGISRNMVLVTIYRENEEWCVLLDFEKRGVIVKVLYGLGDRSAD
jgi:hypothetical protein